MHRYIFITFFFTHLLADSMTIALPSIEVASSKLEETIQESPNTINYLDKENLDIASVKNIQDLSSIISNTNISGIGNRSDKTFSMRGISNYVSLGSSVAMYLDDVPIPASYGFGMVDMHNIKSIEVLKGAQGTLFGKNAESGVIHIYTNAPTKKFTSKVSLGYASYNTKEFYGSVSGPLASEDWTYIFAITKESSDGFSKNRLTQNHFDTRDFTSFNTKLRYNPSSPLDVTLSYTKAQSDDGGSPFKINTKDKPYTIDNQPVDDSLKMDTDMISLVLKYKTQDSTLTSVTSYVKQSVLRDTFLGVNGGVQLNFDVAIEEITQELRFKQNFDNSELLVGGFYSDKLKFNYVENQTLLTLFPIPVSSHNAIDSPDENSALFTQYKYYFLDNYSVTVGVRYQRTKHSFDRVLNNFAAASTQVNGNLVEENILPTFSVSYYTDDGSHTYLTYSKGYRSGGFNYRTSDALVPFEPETTQSLELGHKRTIGSFTNLNTAVFYNKIKNLRINTFDDNLTTITLNAQQAYSYGAEVEVNYKRDALRMFMTGGITKTEMTQLDKNPEYEGKKIIDVPNITANLGTRYNLPQNYYLQSNIKYMGPRYYNMSNTAKESAYVLVNLGFGYKKDELEVLMYANNIFDKEYVDFMVYTPSNNYYHFGAPRVLGFTLSKSF